jgi:hypothetical protein
MVMVYDLPRMFATAIKVLFSPFFALFDFTIRDLPAQCASQ